MCCTLASYQILPIISDRRYLEMQHVLVSIKSSESDESYAECCLSLSKFISYRATSHLCPLTHQGLEVGELDISCQVYIPGMEEDPRERRGTSYDLDSEFIYTEIDVAAPRMVPSSASSSSRLRFQASIDDPTSVSSSSRLGREVVNGINGQLGRVCVWVVLQGE